MDTEISIGTSGTTSLDLAAGDAPAIAFTPDAAHSAAKQPLITVAKVDLNGIFTGLFEIEADAVFTPEMVETLPPDPRVSLAWAWRDGRWLRRAAILDSDNLYLGIDAVEPDKLTDRHVPQLFDCDNQPKRYRWVADVNSSTGGSLHPVARQTPEKKFSDADPLSAMANMFIRIWAVKVMEIPAETMAWLDWYTTTVDFKSNWSRPEVYAFMHRNDEVAK